MRMHNSLPHIFETIIPGIFLTFILTLATCTQTLDNQDTIELQLNEQMQKDLIQLEGQREDLHLQQQEMINRLRDIERQVENEK